MKIDDKVGFTISKKDRLGIWQKKIGNIGRNRNLMPERAKGLEKEVNDMHSNILYSFNLMSTRPDSHNRFALSF